MGEMRNAHRLWVKNQKGLDHFEKRTVFNYMLMEHGVCEVNSSELVSPLEMDLNYSCVL